MKDINNNEYNRNKTPINKEGPIKAIVEKTAVDIDFNLRLDPNDRKWIMDHYNKLIEKEPLYKKEKFRRLLKMLNPDRGQIFFVYYNEDEDIYQIQEFISKLFPNIKKAHIDYDEWEKVDNIKVDTLNENINNKDIRIIYHNYFDRILNKENKNFLNSINRSRDAVSKVYIYFIKMYDNDNNDELGFVDSSDIRSKIWCYLSDYKEFAHPIYPNY